MAANTEGEAESSRCEGRCPPLAGALKGALVGELGVVLLVV
jgi:hypothetical protein